MVAMQNRSVLLRSSTHLGADLPPDAIGRWLVRFPDAVAYAIRMRCEGISHLGKGSRPDWLVQTSDLRFVGHEASDGDTLLHFKLPKFGDAAPELFRQQRIFDPSAIMDLTGIDCLTHVLGDLDAENQESERFDGALLRKVTLLKPIFSSGFTAAEFPDAVTESGRSSALTPRLIEVAERFSQTPPREQQARMVGLLDAMVWSTRAFLLKTDTGEQVRGVLTDGNPETLREWIGKRVLVHGKAVFRPSGSLLRIEAALVESGEGAPAMFSRLPKPAFGLRQRPGPLPKPVQHDGRSVNPFGACFGILKDALDDAELAALRAG